jgi:uncharacterized protein
VTSPRRPSRDRRRLTLTGPLAIAVLLVATVGAEPLTGIPNPRTRDGTWVTDTAGMLRADTIARLNAAIGDLERTHGVEMAVVVIRSLDGLSIEDAAVKLFELWGIGKKNRDNGLLFLWSSGDRRVRVEVGYGLEGALPDGKVGAILDAYVIPRFKSGEFDTGVLAGVDALLRVARNEPVDIPSPRSESYEKSWGIWAWLLGLGSAIPAGLGSLFGFRKWRRNRRRRCPECRTLMNRLAETEDDSALEEGQQAEERVGSVDYDVWKCPACSHQFTLRYPKWVSGYEKCPQCHNRTKSSSEEVLERATTHGAGSARVLEVCAFCSFRHEFTKVLPQLADQSSSSSGSSGGSSGSSFGGGSSGGGGASRGY